MSQLSTLLFLVLIIAIPFLIAMIILYITAISSQQHYCEETRMVSLLRRIHADSSPNKLELVCSGLLQSAQEFLFAGDCFSRMYRSQAELTANYFCTSGSKSWSEHRNLHHIAEVINRTESVATVKVSRLTPVPACLKKFETNLEKMYENQTGPIVSVGWRHLRFSSEDYSFDSFSTMECTRMEQGGVYYDSVNKKLVFQGKYCTCLL